MTADLITDTNRVQFVLFILALAVPLFVHIWRVDRADLRERARRGGTRSDE
jgi:hypothetical protein